MADIRRQLRSGTVVLGGVGLLAAALTACSSDPDKRCVDRDSYTLGKGYRIVSDKKCKSATSLSDDAWYYGGTKKGGWVNGGSFTKPRSGSGGTGGSRSGVTRGGFGGSGKSGG
ncbi:MULTISPECIES: hypothetical protein [Streptomyces]|jgi:hypothetical protein|uniref:Lipoprotein n=1 Tax=Streptomyces thermogriseus TaxID=75292 RepID=A0ABP4DJV5_9ACTN|nr:MULTISPECIES: hypothetical protein [Streptomyces]MDN5381700.1 hypothetical protein [Streptomyces sp. LB8]